LILNPEELFFRIILCIALITFWVYEEVMGMKKAVVCLLLAALLCVAAISAEASQMLNIYLDKDALLAHDIPAADILIRPEGMVRVTRHSLWPWDEEGRKWSMFVEIENTSQEKIVIEDSWLIACKANRDEIAAADCVFAATDKVLGPGERVVLHAGVEPWRMPVDEHDVTDSEELLGLSAFAGKIRRAEILRVRLNTRGSESAQNWVKTDVNAKAWIEDGRLCFEMKNDTDRALAFHTLGAIASDRDGRVMDVIQSSYARGAQAQPGGTIAFEKELQTYITDEMAVGVQFELFAYLMPEHFQ